VNRANIPRDHERPEPHFCSRGPRATASRSFLRLFLLAPEGGRSSVSACALSLPPLSLSLSLSLSLFLSDSRLIDRAATSLDHSPRSRRAPTTSSFLLLEIKARGEARSIEGRRDTGAMAIRTVQMELNRGTTETNDRESLDVSSRCENEMRRLELLKRSFREFDLHVTRLLTPFPRS